MNTISIVFDYNCLINIENSTMDYIDLNEIISIHNSGKIKLYIPAISASEYQKGGLLKSFDEFKKYVLSLGIKNANYLFPMGYWNITKWNYCIFVDKKMVKLEENIKKTLFPSYNLRKELQLLTKKSINHLCDIQSIWCHIYNKKDVFVTEDKKFYKKKQQLIQIGAKSIMSPSEFVRAFKKGVIDS